MLTALHEHFFSNFSCIFSHFVLYGSLFHSVLEHGDCLKMDISQGSVVTLLRCGALFNDDFTASGRILKSGQYLEKLWVRV